LSDHLVAKALVTWLGQLLFVVAILAFLAIVSLDLGGFHAAANAAIDLLIVSGLGWVAMVIIGTALGIGKR